MIAGPVGAANSGRRRKINGRSEQRPRGPSIPFGPAPVPGVAGATSARRPCRSPRPRACPATPGRYVGRGPRGGPPARDFFSIGLRPDEGALRPDDPNQVPPPRGTMAPRGKSRGLASETGAGASSRHVPSIFINCLEILMRAAGWASIRSGGCGRAADVRRRGPEWPGQRRQDA